jgi:protein-S-isoprenylcysteine O-methyltransferase Ste14
MPMLNRKNLKSFLHTHGQRLFDLYLFLSFGGWFVWNTYQILLENRLNLVEGSFIISNFIFVFLFLVRKPQRAINTSICDQTIALIAFCSGAALIGRPPTGGAFTMLLADTIIIIANILGIATLLNLGKSFGILIACREVKVTGLYSIIRHPMYFTDILLRVGYIVSHFDLVSLLIFIGSTACYIYRAILEERFLAAQPEYAAYMQVVRYRFIPYIF